MSIFWAKKQIITAVAILWWVFTEYVTDTMMQGIRDFLSHWKPAIVAWDLLSANPALIALSIFVGVTIWGYVDTARSNKGKFGQSVEVRPTTGKPTNYERNELTAWADLVIKNTSPSSADMSVKIVEVVQVYEKENEQGKGTGIYHLFEPSPKWSPASVYWSGRTGTPRQFVRTVQPNESQYATIAFHHRNMSGIGTFNTLTQPPLLESKIVIEVSSPNMRTWQGTYYIEYHPPGRDSFEFVEWASWCKNHPIEELNLGRVASSD